MMKFGLLLGVLFLSLMTLALPKASDFQEVGVGDGEAAEATVVSDQEENNTLGVDEALVSGTVRVMRKIAMTEVFFKDLKDSYFIPSGGGYSAIFKACQESEKKGTPVGLKVNTKSRRILSVEESAAKKPASGAK